MLLHVCGPDIHGIAGLNIRRKVTWIDRHGDESNVAVTVFCQGCLGQQLTRGDRPSKGAYKAPGGRRTVGSHIRRAGNIAIDLHGYQSGGMSACLQVTGDLPYGHSVAPTRHNPCTSEHGNRNEREATPEAYIAHASGPYTLHDTQHRRIRAGRSNRHPQVAVDHSHKATSFRHHPPMRFLTLADVAETLNVSGAQVYALVRSGALPAIKVGGRGQWRVESRVLEEFITAQYAQTRTFVRTHPR